MLIPVSDSVIHRDATERADHRAQSTPITLRTIDRHPLALDPADRLEPPIGAGRRAQQAAVARLIDTRPRAARISEQAIHRIGDSATRANRN